MVADIDKQEVCLSINEIAGLLTTLGLGIFVTVLFLATIAEGRPLTELGKRPRGRGLFSFLYHYYAENTGVWGYDPIQGALSPPLRLKVHLSVTLCWWATLLTLLFSFRPFRTALSYQAMEQQQHGGDGNICFHFGMNDGGSVGKVLTALGSEHANVLWQVGAVALASYLCFFYVAYRFLPGVSTPGGPRAHKIQRHPIWKDKYTPLPASLEAKWRYASSEDSHQVSEERFTGTAAAITGEPSGRDIWTNQPRRVATECGASTMKEKKTKKKSLVDERLVQEMAWGGRPCSGFNPSVNVNSCEAPFRAEMIRKYCSVPGNRPPSLTSRPQSTKEALHKAVHFYSMLQSEDGHWAGDYGGPMFLMPGLIVAWYVMGQPEQMLDSEQVELVKHYIVVHQQQDGGWGTHIESPSTMFGTTLNYVSLRLLGMEADHPVAKSGRAFIREQGGALMTSSWAKFYLCLLGCMSWDGHNSVPPEMWLLPNWIPFHPGRMWCHARMVYLPMGYLYGSRFVYDKAESDPLIAALREELYCEPYDSIPWIRTRHKVADMDNYSPLPWTMMVIQNILARYETWPIFQPFKNYVRKFGLRFSVDYMAAEDLQTNYIDIGPVNKVLNMVSAYHAAGSDIHDPKVMNHLVRIQDYLWLAEDGMKMKGYNGSQCWDTSFAAQAFYEADLMDDFPDLSEKLWDYFERCQILSTETSQSTAAFAYESAGNRKKYYRHISQGGWPFSTSAHGWPISDCTAEGLKAILCLIKSKTVQDGLRKGKLKSVGETRLQDAVNVLLSYQNEDGGFATYENNRGFGWYESLNPSEVFGDIMIDYSYVECSMASLTGLVEFHEMYPQHRTIEVQHAIHAGRDFLKSIQRDDGSWYGSWACCFCYGCWFGVEGLVKCGEPLDSEHIKKACKFLLSHQRPNGGWGEDFTSCYDKDYAKEGMKAYGDEGSGVVNTAWALLALAAARYDEDIEAVKHGVKYLMKRQLSSGDWPQEGIAGVFNRACGITYTAYRNVFPIWALGRCRATYGATLDD